MLTVRRGPGGPLVFGLQLVGAVALDGCEMAGRLAGAFLGGLDVSRRRMATERHW